MVENKGETQAEEFLGGIYAFVEGGKPVPTSQKQIEKLTEFFDIAAEAIQIGSEKLKLVQSKIIGKELWLKLSDGDYYAVNPDPSVQTVVRADENMNKKSLNIGIYGDDLDAIIEMFRKKIEDSKKES
jgi:hypothetical protein